jgi:hypothetical protein
MVKTSDFDSENGRVRILRTSHSSRRKLRRTEPGAVGLQQIRQIRPAVVSVAGAACLHEWCSSKLKTDEETNSGGQSRDHGLERRFMFRLRRFDRRIL